MTQKTDQKTDQKIDQKIDAANYLLLVGALVPPSALDVFGTYLDEQVVATPYGEIGPLALRGPSEDGGSGQRCWIQPYTGLPTRTDPRATLYAARELGLTSVLSWDMGIALNAALRLGQTVIACDYIDRARHQPPTFYSYEGNEELPPDLLLQIQNSFHQPMQLFDPAVADYFQQQGASGVPSVPAVYLGVDGPRRETPAEARLYRQWGADVVGHNLIPEAFLAHELGLRYTGIVTIRNYSADLVRERVNRGDTSAVPLGIERTLQKVAALIGSAA